MSIGGQHLGDFVQMAYVDSEQMTLRSCGILSCALTNTRVCARPSDPLQFRNGSKGAVKNGASEPRQRTLGGGSIKRTEHHSVVHLGDRAEGDIGANL